MSVRGQHELSDRLAQDLLFFCSHARPPQPRATRRRGWRRCAGPGAWTSGRTADYETPRLGRFDPALVSQARKRVAAAKDAWSAVAGGELHRLRRAGRAVCARRRLAAAPVPAGDVLAQALAAAVAQTVAGGADAAGPRWRWRSPPACSTSMPRSRTASSTTPSSRARVQHLARRIDEVRSGAEPQPLEIWMEELYRRVSDRQTMGSVVQELRASLSEVEKQIDQYFRNPAQREVLIPVPAQLSAMRGVLSVLGLEPGLAGGGAHARRGGRAGADRGRPAARHPDRHLRPPGRQPRRA